MDRPMTTLHYSAVKENEILKLREKYASYGERVKAAKLTVKQRAQAAGLTTGVLAVTMAILGMLCIGTWHVVPLGIALYIAGFAGVLAAKPVYQYVMSDSDQEGEK